MATLTVNTDKFGEIEVKEDSIITFVQPIMGFDDYKRFVVVEDKEFSPIAWLQSVEEPALAFPIIDPSLLNIEYGQDNHSFTLEDIRLNGIGDAAIYTLMVIPDGRVERIRTNLRAPVVINPVERLAKQVVCEDSRYPLQYYMASRN